MESIGRRDLQVRISVAPGREDKEHDQVGVQVYLSHGFRCGRCGGDRSSDSGVHEEPFMRRNGYRDQRLHALYMNNSTYVCLIRRGVMGWFRGLDHTRMYVCVSDAQGSLSDERGEGSARMVVNLGQFHWSSPARRRLCAWPAEPPQVYRISTCGKVF